MTLKDLKAASEGRKEKAESGEISQAVARSQKQNTAVQMLGARVLLSVHRGFQTQLFETQERFPDLTTQWAIPALLRALRKPEMWCVLLDELSKD